MHIQKKLTTVSQGSYFPFPCQEKCHSTKCHKFNIYGSVQACNLSPLLFNIYIEQVINECKEYCPEIKVNGMRIQMLRFADDIAIIAQDEINLKRALERSDDILKSNYRMKINRIKTEAIVCSRFWNY